MITILGQLLADDSGVEIINPRKRCTQESANVVAVSPQTFYCTAHGTGLPPSPGLLGRIIEQGLDAVIAPTDPPDLTGYLELATAGGMPPAVLKGEALAALWN